MKKLFHTLSGMTFLEKLDHIWTYYKLHILGVVAALALIIIWGSSIYENSKEVLIQGELLNTGISIDGYNYLTQDSFAALGGTHNRQVVRITATNVGDPATDSTTYTQQLKFFAQIEGQNLDFLILDETQYRYYILSDFYMDLREIFTPEEMTRWEDIIVDAQSETLGGSYPAGLRLDDTNLAKTCLPAETSYYLVFITNTTRPAACRAFWHHILNY